MLLYLIGRQWQSAQGECFVKLDIKAKIDKFKNTPKNIINNNKSTIDIANVTHLLRMLFTVYIL